jgi:hypothetical protein
MREKFHFIKFFPFSDLPFTFEFSPMKQSLKNFGLHLLVFILIEIIFVLLVFREFPETNFITLIGILHTTYWIILLIAWRLREKVTTIWQKWLCTFVPLVYHLFIHIYATRAAIDMHHHDHHDHDMIWMIVWVVVLWVLIFVWEYVLHRKIHCDTHHADAHKHCHDEDCIKTHQTQEHQQQQ